jgi:hypothetical protein
MGSVCEGWGPPFLVDPQCREQVLLGVVARTG